MNRLATAAVAVLCGVASVFAAEIFKTPADLNPTSGADTSRFLPYHSSGNVYVLKDYCWIDSSDVLIVDSDAVINLAQDEPGPCAV